jgi:hypothetical protein
MHTLPPLQVKPQARGPFLRKRASVHLGFASIFVDKSSLEPSSKELRWGRCRGTRRDLRLSGDDECNLFAGRCRRLPQRICVPPVPPHFVDRP